MLNLRQVKHLAQSLDTTRAVLEAVLDDADTCYEDLILLDPAKPDKPRPVVNVTGRVRAFQAKLYRRLLLPKLLPSVHSYGGVRGRHIKSNAEVHLRSAFVFKTDISDFYPSIHRRRVYELFVGPFGCSPDVARLCTRLCTYRHHLALGLITSPFLADQILLPIDARIGAACRKAGLFYTRYVDDLSISGPFDLENSGFEAVVLGILSQHGFLTNPKKHEFHPLSKRVSITNIRSVRGHLDVRAEYVAEVERQLDDAARLANGQPFEGPYYTAGQIRGRIQFVCWVNPNRSVRLLRQYRMIPWNRVAEAALSLGLVATKPKLYTPGEFAAVHRQQPVQV